MQVLIPFASIIATAFAVAPASAGAQSLRTKQ